MMEKWFHWNILVRTEREVLGAVMAAGILRFALDDKSTGNSSR